MFSGSKSSFPVATINTASRSALRKISFYQFIFVIVRFNFSTKSNGIRQPSGLMVATFFMQSTSY